VADIPSAIGRYEIISRLGQGGMGSLYLAKDPKIGRLVAIKLVRQEFDSPEARQRFAREAQSAGALRHPNIVTIFDVDEYDGLPYIAMEYVDGETLAEIVRRKAPLSVTQRLQWVEELCSGLAYAHRQGIVHRDVKPANLMVDNEGALKILDFGLARREASKFTQTHTIIGTPNYMSPEQIRAGDVGPPSDIFAVGTVLYELLVYVEAFPGKVHQAMHKILHEEPKPLSDVFPGIDPAIVTILARALEKDPARRYADLAVMRTELAQVRQRLERRGDEGTPTIVSPAPPAHRPGSSVRHTPQSGVPGSGGSRRFSSGTEHRATLQKKRAAQIDLHLAQARKLCDAGALDEARTEAEHALMFDPDHPVGLHLIDEIAAEEERLQIAQLVAAARAELQQGRLDAAEQIVAQALEIAPHAPDVVQLRETIDTARREIERARQVQDMLRRARTRFSEGSFEGAIRAVGELLAIDPNNTAARDLQARAQEALEARAHRAERDAAARAAVTDARALFEKGDKDAAIATLEAFAPPHDLVSGFLASLREEHVAEALQDDALTDPLGMPPVRVPAATLPAESAVIPPPAARSRAPLYAGIAAAGVVVAWIGWKVFAGSSETGAPPAEPAAAAARPAPAPVVPPPAVVTPPASLSSQPAQNQNERDAMAAYKLLSAGRHVEAAKIASQIARRDPTNENLKDLRAQIQTVAETEKQRAAAVGDAKVPPASAAGSAPLSGGAPPEKPAAPAGDPAVTPPAADKPAAPPPSTPPARVEAAGPPPPPPLTAAEIERPAIEASIQEYAKALSSMNLPAVARVRRYSPSEARNWENIFKQLSEYRLIVKVTGNPTIDGDRATIPVEEQFAQTAKKGGIQVFSQARKTEYKLERIAGKWMLIPPS
jgi:tetratricopeptide (TPR) repeat protein